jgi:ABC-type nitrate/sulfonate/bicarbonate transport system substrate-binding protein
MKIYINRISNLIALFIVISLSTTVLAQDLESDFNLLLGDVSLNKLPFVMAYEEGIYDLNGLNVTPVFTQRSVETIRGSGLEVSDDLVIKPGMETPIRISGASPTIVRLTTQAGAPDMLIIGSTHLRSRWHIVGRNDINSPEQLKGKRIGYSGVGAVTHFDAINFALAMGWDPRFDISLMAGGLSVEALRSGYIDAFVADNIHGTMAIGAGFKVIVDLSEYDFPVAGSAIFVDRDWLRDNRERVRQFMKSTVEAIHLLKTDKAAAFRTIRKWYQMTDIELLEYFYNGVQRMPAKPYPPVEGLKRVMEIYDSHEMRKYSLEYFYDDSFVKELDESGYIDNLYRQRNY